MRRSLTEKEAAEKLNLTRDAIHDRLIKGRRKFCIAVNEFVKGD
jgi:predicted DNA-binding protein (UPF0251 family)